MDNMLYDRQQGLSLSVPKSATVIGVGGTGSWVAILLAMSGVQNLYLYDDDRLELTNLNRLPFTTTELGLPKTEVVSKLIRSLRPEVYIETFGKAEDTTLAEVEHQIIIDCTDRHSAQLEISKWAQENHVTYRRVGYDGTHITVVDAIPEWTTEQARDAGYEHAPSWVVPAVFAAALGAMSIMYSPVNMTGDISDVRVQLDEVPKVVLNEDRRTISMRDIELQLANLSPIEYVSRVMREGEGNNVAS